MYGDDKFIEANRGRWVVRHAGILVTAQSFFTKQIAEQWARWNYKETGCYDLERIPRLKQQKTVDR